MRLVVTHVVSETTFGSIFAGEDEVGTGYRVRSPRLLRVHVGETYDVEGTESEYHGPARSHRQIDARSLLRVRTSGRLLVPWLKRMEGIGTGRANRLFATFGGEVATVLADPSRLSELAACLAPAHPKLGFKLAERIVAAHAAIAAGDDIGIAETQFLVRLEEIGVSETEAAQRLWRLIGSPDAFDRVLANPYLVAAVLPWPIADGIARKALHGRLPTSAVHALPDRLLGGVDAAWRRLLATGSTASSRTELVSALRRLDVPADEAIELALRSGRIRTDGNLMRAPGAAHLENRVAQELMRLADLSGAAPFAPPRPAALAQLNEDQRAAVLGLLRGSRVGVLQGGAGTGKTTTMKIICQSVSQEGWNVVLTAISAKATLRLSRAVGRHGMTMARLLHGLQLRRTIEHDAGSEAEVSAHLPAITDRTLVIVDEASMVDLVSWRRLLEQMPSGAVLIMVGDVSQLPPIGLGRVFHDLVAHWPQVQNLERVVRHSEGGGILEAAQAIRAGATPALPPFRRPAEGAWMVECASDDILQKTLAVRRAIHAGNADILIVAAMNRTCRAVAEVMQAELRARGTHGCRVGPLLNWVSLGEPVVPTVNRYAEGLANGLLGTVTALDPLRVRFDLDTESKEMSGAAKQELASAWAVTVHRSQGSEAKHVIVMLDSPTIITREWLYTAVTRATAQLVLVGPRDVLRSAVGNRERRQTGFGLELRKLIPQNDGFPVGKATVQQSAVETGFRTKE